MTITTLRCVSLAFVASLAACSQTNQSHCANRDGDRTCAEQDGGSHPQCSSCESANNGCVEASTELMGSCHAETVADTSTSNGSDPTTDDSVSSTTATTSTTNPTTTNDTMTTDPVTTMSSDTMTTSPTTTMPATTAEDTTTSVSTTDGTETGSSGETTTESSSSTDPSETAESSSTGVENPCNNGVLDEGEECDGADLAGQTCLSQGLGAGDLACDSQCQFNTTDCLPALGCGNGVLNGNEECEGDELSVADCDTLNPNLYGGGKLSCNNANCTFDTQDCCVQTGNLCNAGTNCCGICGGVACL